MSETNPYAENLPLSPQSQRSWAVAFHLLAIPFEFFAPVIGYLFLNGKGQFISHHVRESLNFGITMLIAVLALAISIVGLLVLWVPPIIWFIFRLIAAYNTLKGEFYRYPLTLRLVKN